MEYLLTAKEMKECDRVTIEEYGIPSLVLMERAALGVVEILTSGDFCLKKTLVVCGSGNNGGDGFAIARVLKQKNIETAVLFVGKEASLTEETRIQRKICENYGMNICSNGNMFEYTCIVDAIFGIGISREIQGRYREIIEHINRAPADVLAVDIPSGINADTGIPMGIAVKAKETVTFAYGKPGQFLYPGASYCGKLHIKDIGITNESFQGKMPGCICRTKLELKDLPARRPDSNKGTYGKTMLIAGTENMAGAAYLAGEAAYRTGTGLVRILTEKCNRTIIQSTLPEAVLMTYDPQSIPMDIEGILYGSTGIGVGPGLGTTSGKKELLRLILRKGSVPLVLDADALNILSEHSEWIGDCKVPVIITPHILEMSRLTGLSKEYIKSNLLEVCSTYAREKEVICVLKDARTIISDGDRTYMNLTGTNGMSTGGSGDVLTGIITGLLSQGMSALSAAVTGVWIHGKAGELAAGKCGNRSMLARDLIAGVTELLGSLERKSTEGESK